jgi:hypothetical protein
MKTIIAVDIEDSITDMSPAMQKIVGIINDVGIKIKLKVTEVMTPFVFAAI